MKSLRGAIMHKRISQPSMRLPAFAAFLTLGAAITLLINLTSPSDPKNAVFLGYSLERILLGGGLLALTLALLFLTWKLVHQPELSLRLWQALTDRGRVSDAVFWLSLGVFALFLIVLLTPSYRLAGNLSEYAARLHSVLVWLAVSGGVAALMILFGRRRGSLKSILLMNRTAVHVGLLLFGIFLLTWALVALTGIGIRDQEDYWYGAGVPVLGLQILFSLALGVVFLWVKPKYGRRFDLLIFLLFWGASAWLWARQPLSTNYFFPDTANNPVYPYSDSALFDTGSQFALIGQGLFNGQYFDRAAYSAFLTFLHALAGQDVHRLMDLQAVVFAILPSIVYLIGRELHSRALGVSAAALIALRGMNAIITARWIDTASPKMMMTDFPTSIGIAVFLLLALKWMKNPSRHRFAVWAGGALGMTVMLRTHVFMLLPVALIFAFVFIKPRWSRAALGSFLLILGMLTATLPWDMRNLSNDIPLFYTYYHRIELILRYRYGILEGAYKPPPETPASVLPLRARNALREANAAGDNVCSSTPCSIVNHMIHNGITSVLFLPTTFVLHDHWNTVKLGEPFWRANWDGDGMAPMTAGFILFNLAMLSLGVGAAWERNKIAALLTVILLPAYFATNALGLTSGGRYIVPIDWIICVFFMAGLLQVAFWILRLAGFRLADESPLDTGAAHESGAPPIRSVFANLVLVFAMGALIPLADLPFERRYQERGTAETLARMQTEGWLEMSGYTLEELSQFLDQPRTRLVEGRLLYPRHYPAGSGQYDLSTHYMIREYPRLVFIVIGPDTSMLGQNVLMPGANRNIEIHAADVIVAGCSNTAHYASFIDALFVIILTDPPSIHHRNPVPPLQCPFEEPASE
jgi:hypothetical protein